MRLIVGGAGCSGKSHWAPFLLASLLLHLALLSAALRGGVFPPPQTAPPMAVVLEYVELSKLESVPQRQSVRPLPAPHPAASSDRRAASTKSAPFPARAPGAVAPAAAAAPRPALPGPPTVAVPAPAQRVSSAPAPVAALAGDVKAASAGAGRSGVEPAGAGAVGAAVGAHGGAGGAAQHAKGSGSQAGKGAPRAMADYQALLFSLIESHKRYPLAARKLQLEGSCQRRFVIGRSGVLKGIQSVTSCGHDFLDEAASAAISAVRAFPPLPEEYQGAEAAFTVPITFTLSKR